MIRVFTSNARILFFSGFTAIFYLGCASNRFVNSESNGQMPNVILWAWERPEDLRFLDAKKYGVAFLAQTLFLQNDEVVFQPRRQPLKVSPDTYLIAVTRIETDKTNRPPLSDTQKNEIVSYVKQTLEMPRVKAVQIDFDALASERGFYKSLVRDLKKTLPADTPLTITALASWCASDNWISDLPIDEAVPMAFQMGADDKPVRAFLADGNDWREPLCRKSYGISLNEPLQADFKPNRRFFIFNSNPNGWKAGDLERFPKGVSSQ
ncbi:MAG: DUF3142 domain-containing protein [Pyrinomonadaceae bacterium]